METVYVIIAQHDDYDSPSFPLGFVETEEKGDNIVAQLTEFNRIATGLRDEFKSIREKVDQLEVPTSEMKDYPRWVSVLAKQPSISPKMRKKRDDILAANLLVQEEHADYRRAMYEREVEAVTKHVDSLDGEYTEDFMTYLRDNMSIHGTVSTIFYSHEEVSKMTL